MTHNHENKIRIFVLNAYFGSPTGYIECWFKENLGVIKVDIAGMRNNNVKLTINLRTEAQDVYAR